MSRYSPGLKLTWKIAAVEAAAAQWARIEPEHLFIGVSKMEDPADPAALRGLGLAASKAGALRDEIAAVLRLLVRFGLRPRALPRETRDRKGAGRPESQAAPGHTGGVRSVAFSPDGRTLASVGEDGTMQSWG